MDRFKIVFTAVLSIIFLVIASIFIINYFWTKPAGILIETTPVSSVFIDGIQVGRTPYEATRKPGEAVLRLIPESSDKPLVPLETKVNLVSGIKTVVRREFADTEEASSGEIISFEKTGGREASLAVVSIPDSAQVSLDGASKGSAPLATSSISQGSHQLALAISGYLERTLMVKAITGYKLIVLVKLAKNPESQVSDKVKKKVVVVEILSTPTGFLRVRSEPSATSAEIGQVTPGQKYPFLEEDEASGWFKIQYSTTQAGWITNQYAKKEESK